MPFVRTFAASRVVHALPPSLRDSQSRSVPGDHRFCPRPAAPTTLESRACAAAPGKNTLQATDAIVIVLALWQLRGIVPCKCCFCTLLAPEQTCPMEQILDVCQHVAPCGALFSGEARPSGVFSLSVQQMQHVFASHCWDPNLYQMFIINSTNTSKKIY